MASKSYVGAAPLTMARTKAGGYVYIYAGEPVTDDIDPDDQKRLVDEGFLAEAAASDESAPSTSSRSRSGSA